MGLTWKHYIDECERFAQYKHVAGEIMVRAGILQRCPHCHAIYDRFFIVSAATDLTEAYRIASAMIRDDDPLLGSCCDRQAMLDTIKELAVECAAECSCPTADD
jgi:hypothetical protein